MIRKILVACVAVAALSVVACKPKTEEPPVTPPVAEEPAPPATPPVDPTAPTTAPEDTAGQPDATGVTGADATGATDASAPDKK